MHIYNVLYFNMTDSAVSFISASHKLGTSTFPCGMYDVIIATMSLDDSNLQLCYNFMGPLSYLAHH